LGKLFYSNANSCITNNGYFSEFFNIKKGVRQGCPLSPSLFIICIEFLANNIRNYQNIKGVKIGNIEIKQTLFADDACFPLDGSQQSFENLISTLNNFSNISGLKLNNNKCSVMTLGSLTHKNVKYCPKEKFEWNCEHAKVLGIELYNTTNATTKYNISNKLQEFDNCLQKWKKWKLSLIGKITVLKTFALPKIIYPLTVLEGPNESIVNELKTKMFKFLWNDKPDKIKQTQIIQDYTRGGLKMIDIESFIAGLKASWIKRFIYRPESKLTALYSYFLENYGNFFILKNCIKPNDIKSLNIKSSFLKEILISWAKLNIQRNIDNIGKEIIWNNSHIRNKHTGLLFYKKWHDRGIDLVEHLYDYRVR